MRHFEWHRGECAGGCVATGFIPANPIVADMVASFWRLPFLDGITFDGLAFPCVAFESSGVPVSNPRLRIFPAEFLGVMEIVFGLSVGAFEEVGLLGAGAGRFSFVLWPSMPPRDSHVGAPGVGGRSAMTRSLIWTIAFPPL